MARMRGFVYDAPDESVGIFGDAWIHEACDVTDFTSAHDAEVIIQVMDSYTEGEGANRWLITPHLLTCPECVQQVIVFAQDADPDFPEDIPDWWPTPSEPDYEPDYDPVEAEYQTRQAEARYERSIYGD